DGDGGAASGRSGVGADAGDAGGEIAEVSVEVVGRGPGSAHRGGHGHIDDVGALGRGDGGDLAVAVDGEAAGGHIAEVDNGSARERAAQNNDGVAADGRPA